MVITDINEDGAATAEQLGPDCIFRRHDVASEKDWADVAGLAKEHFGKVDILVNNAGITGYEATETISPEAMRRYFDIHVMGALFGMQAVVPIMAEEGGSIINIASTAAVRGLPSYVGYGTSKWGLRGLSRYAAFDLVAKNIRVNCVMPGGVETEMLRQAAGQDLIDAARQSVPMKRFGTTSEIAQAVLFLASDQSSYMTGAELILDGGLNA
ncbi:3alpha(or 20beta)-hydroxysteroid dehydrogenase [Croceicoccus sp. BE223]|nr:3alpha(or 20beta)-hydroxysteroid dehydrogenase [Croceicoccus sp. BE223]